MALVLADRVRETTTSTGTTTITLAGAVTGFQSFSAVGDGNFTYYCIAGQGTTEWEVGIGTYTASGTTLSRDTVLSSSNAGSLVPFSAGTKDVFVTYPAEKSVNYEDAGGVIITDASINDALRITQVGTGNALVVEDAANPDSTPFIIDNVGNVGIGAIPAASNRLRITGTYAANVGTTYAVSVDGTVDPAVATTAALINHTVPTVSAGTLPALTYYNAQQGTFTGTVTTQYGFYAHSNMIGATNNYAFYGNIPAGTGDWNFYANGTASNAFAGNSSFGTTSAPTAKITLGGGTATASTGPLKFTSGTNLSSPEIGSVEYDGTIMSATPNTGLNRTTIPLTNYTSGAGTALTTNGEATLQSLLPAANNVITLPIGTYFLDTAFTVTRGASTTAATARLNILGTGNAVGTFSGTSLSSTTSGGTTTAFPFNAVNINVSNVLTASSSTSGGAYQITLRGLMKITTTGTIAPQYNLSANINGAGTVSNVFYFRLQQVDSQSAAAFGPAGTGWS